MSNLYLCSAVLKHYQDQGCREDDLPLVHWACRSTIHRAQQSLLAVFWNLPNRAVAVLIRGLIFPSGKPYSPPSDTVIQKAAAVLLTDSETRDRLTLGIYLNSAENDPSGRIERAFQAVLRAGPAQKKLDQARRSGRLKVKRRSELVQVAREAGVIDETECQLLEAAERATCEAISVDEFSPEAMVGNQAGSEPAV
jgi:acyl-CoA dehydrogenase